MNNPWQSRKPAAPRAPSKPRADSPAPARPSRNEVRLYGLNAIQAVFEKRPEAIRKVYLTEDRLSVLKPLLAWCVENKVGYRLVDETDLQKLAQSQHHEGVVAEVLRQPELPLQDFLDELPAGPQCLVWLDGVGNPHNLGAILRSCAHFGAAAVLIPSRDPINVSGAAARVAEGGAESVSLVRLPERTLDGITVLKRNGFAVFATVVDGGESLFAVDMPERVVWMIGAEGEGMDRSLAELADQQISIPGSGAVESLNVSAATAVWLAQSARPKK